MATKKKTSGIRELSVSYQRKAAAKRANRLGAEGPKQSSPVKKKSLFNAKGQLKERPAKRGK